MQDLAKTVIIGIGNLYRNDDAVGLHVVRQLRQRLLPATVKILECRGESTELMEAWKRAGNVFLVDALWSGNAAGFIQRIDVSRDALPANLRQSSTHAFGLAEAVELARVLGSLPQRTIVFGIEGENFEAGQSLSPAVQQAIDRCCELIETEVAGLEVFHERSLK